MEPPIKEWQGTVEVLSLSMGAGPVGKAKLSALRMKGCCPFRDSNHVFSLSASVIAVFTEFSCVLAPRYFLASL